MIKWKWILAGIGITLLLLGCSSDSNYGTLTVERTGAGTGTVTSDPDGIDCGTDCAETFRNGTEVTLTATADADAVFAGWLGPCEGTGDCALTVNGDITVTARFNQGGGEPPPAPTGFLTPVGTFATDVFDESAAEIAAHDPATQRLFVVNGNDDAVDILDLRSPTTPTRIGQIPISGLGGGINSVAFHNGLLAAAIEAETAQDNGTVAFFDAEGDLLGQVEVGPLPDMLAFTPDGDTVLAALEGEPNDDYSVDPEGGVAVIDISGGPAAATVRTATFTAFNDQASDLMAAGLRIFGPGATLAEDVEPEYIAVSPDGTTAFVTLQENNAVAAVDIAAAEVTAIFPLGTKDHSLEMNAMDASDRDDAINIRTWPVRGMYQPDAIATVERNGSLYLVTANEGDARDYDTFSEEVRVEDLTLDPDAFPNAADLQAETALGRLTVTNTMGDTDGDGDYDRLYSFGARSFTVWEVTSAGPIPVYDSGSDFERITARRFPEHFNNDNDENDPDSRSDAKGPEPEGVTIGMVGGVPHAFIGLERIGGVMVYSLDQPANPQFVAYINNRDFTGDPEAGTAGDLGPEGLVFIPAEDSPTGDMMLAVTNEVSGTTTLYSVTPDAAEAPMAMLQLLHASDLEGGVEALENAPNFAAIADYFDDRYPTLVVSAGDNYIPGPFFNAAGDDAVEDSLRRVLANPDASAGVGRGDIAIMNLIGFDATAFGNHEFDAGTGVIGDNIGTDIDMDAGTAEWLGTQFPYLSANLDFSNDGNLSGLFTDALLEGSAFQSRRDDLTAAADAPKIAPAAILRIGKTAFGVVGGTTPRLESISSPGDTRVKEPGAGTNDMDAFATHIQPQVDRLLAAGVDKIILTTHLQQLALEQELIGALRGVDIVIAGGSDTLLADDEDVARGLRAGDTPAATYPIQTTNADGDPALIVSTDGEYSYVGRLVVAFDENGRIVPESVDPNVSGVFATTEAGTMALWGDGETAFQPGAKGFGVRTLAEAIRGVVVAKDGQVFGSTAVYLNGAREDVRTQETNLGNLTADANLAAARAVDSTVAVSIKNGGGIRAAIGEIQEVSPGVYEPVPPQANPASGKQEGQISQLDIENSLRFNNELTIMTLSAADLLAVMEHAVSATEPGATPGQFPQVGGMAFSFDPTQPPGDRIQSLALVDDNGSTVDVIAQNGEVAGDPARPIRIVTLNFLAGGGDGYPFDTLGADVVETEIGEQSALADYLAANYAGGAAFMMADTEPANDTRIQNLSAREDTVIGDGAAPTVSLAPLGTFETGVFDEGAAEIAAYDPSSRRLFVVNGNADAVDVLDISSPSAPTRLNQIPISGFGGGINSVAFQNGILAAAIEAETAQDDGTVAFFDADGNLLGQATVGPLPDMLAFTPDGNTLVAAIEGEPSDDYSVDPEGAVAIIDLSSGPAGATVQTASFTAFNDQTDTLTAAGLRIFGPGATLAQDVEPEYIAVSPDGTTAFVTLQENNAVAAVDIAAAEVTAIFPLGTKDHSIERNALDASDRDGGINIRTWPVHGMYQPDAIAALERNGSLYLVTANEGDARDYDTFSEEVRVEDLTLDPDAFPNAADLQAEAALGRLTVTNTMGDIDGDGDHDRLFSFGARSFTVWEVTSEGPFPVYDSGSDFERITAQLFPENFNTDNDENDPDSRSDAKGPEPEGVTIGQVGGIPHAFIGLERIGGVMVYNLDQPANPQFVTYINNRDFDGAPEAGAAGDLGPEGLVFIPAAESPTGGMLLAVTNEVSGTTTLYSVGSAP